MGLMNMSDARQQLSGYSLVRSYLIGAALVGLCAFLAACSKPDEVAKEPAVRPVKLLTIDHTASQKVNRYPATLDASQSSDLSFQVGGKIAELNIKEAQIVQQGDVLAKLDAQDLDSSLASAKAKYDVAEEDYQTGERLLKEDAIARNVVAQRKSARDVALAAYESAQKAVQDSIIVAPFSGAIAKIPVQALQRVQAGELIATLIDGTEMDVEFNLPARIISQVKDRNKDNFVVLEAFPDQRFPAKFKEASLIADATSQTYAITLTFVPPADRIILPGMSATVEVAVGRNDQEGEAPKTRVDVPLSAFVSNADEKIVWIVEPQAMTVSQRVVEVEEGIGEYLFVTDGLNTGDTIVIAGADYLAEGMKVRAWESQK